MKTTRMLFAALLMPLVGNLPLHAETIPAPLPAPWDLRCEGQREPLGISAEPPCLSWKLADDRRGAAQTCYQILAASRPDLLVEGKEDLWNSGRVESAQNHLVPFGKPLASGQRVHWKVRYWDKNGRPDPSPWSEPASFEMTLLKPADWQAKWIEAKPAPVNNPVTERWGDFMFTQSEPATPELDEIHRARLRLIPGLVVMGQDFNLKKVPDKARIYATSRGYYTIYINGKRVADEEHEPAFVGKDEAPYFASHDVTSLLRPGANHIRCLVRQRWTAAPYSEAGYSSELPKPFKLLLQLDAETGRKKEVLAKTDGTWRQTTHPIIKGTFFFGEVYDARQENPLINGAAITTKDWQPVQESADAIKVRPRIYQPERVTKVVTPVEVFSPAPGVWTFDLGEMISGGVEWQVPDDLPAGSEVVFRYGQELRRQKSHMAGLEWHYPPENRTEDKSRLLAQYSESGIVINMGGPNKQGASGTLSPQKTLSHIPCDLFVSGGLKGAVWRSSERNHAFRYVEVVGLKSQPRVDSLKGLMIHNDSPQVGTFQSSEPHLNRFHDLCAKTQLMNEHGMFSDCWDREKWAWGGNWPKGRFILYAHDNTGLNRKATADYAETLQRLGKLGFDTFYVGNPWASTTVMWPASFLYWPWEAYKFTGDIRPLRDNFDSLLRHIRDVYERQQQGGKSLVIKTDTSIADWLWFGQEAAGGFLKDRPELTEKWTDGKPFGFRAPRSQCHVMSTAIQAEQAGILAGIAEQLGRTEDAKWLKDLHEQTKAALHREFYNAEAFSYGKNPDSGPWGTDVEDSIMLETGIAPLEVREKVYAQMLEGLRKRGHSVINGIITMQHFTNLLANHGDADDAFEVYNREGPSGIRNFMETHPDALAEAFHHRTPEKRNGTSRCHADMAGWGHWLYYGLGGLRPDESAPGFKHFVLAPQIPRKMSSAEITHESPYGKIVSAWSKTGDKLTWKVVVPPNSSATALIPAASAEAIREGGKPLAEAGLKAKAPERGAIPVELPAGTYAFEFDLPPPPPMKTKPLSVWKKSDLPDAFDGGNFVQGESAGMLDALSVALWVRAESSDNEWNPILFTDHGNRSAFHFALRKGGWPIVAINNGQDWIHATAKARVIPGSWHHVAVVCDPRKGGEIRFYIDGKDAGTQELNLGIPLDMDAYRLGAWKAWSAQPDKNFHGAMDAVRLYSGLLQDHEIEEIMRESPPEKANQP